MAKTKKPSVWTVTWGKPLIIPPKKKSKKPRKTITERVEDVLARAMHDYADYCAEERALGGSYWVVFPRDHAAFLHARRSILRLLREVARG